MKVRKAKKSEKGKQWAREVSRRDARIADLETQLDKALALVKAQAEQIKALTERIAQLENEFGQPSPLARNAAWTYSSSFANRYCLIGWAHLRPAFFSIPDSRTD